MFAKKNCFSYCPFDLPNSSALQFSALPSLAKFFNLHQRTVSCGARFLIQQQRDVPRNPHAFSSFIPSTIDVLFWMCTVLAKVQSWLLYLILRSSSSLFWSWLLYLILRSSSSLFWSKEATMTPENHCIKNFASTVLKVG